METPAYIYRKSDSANQVSNADSMNETRYPTTAISPAQLWVSANASGIMVSMIIVSMAPAAMAVVMATTNGEKASNTAYPASEDKPTGSQSSEAPASAEAALPAVGTG